MPVRAYPAQGTYLGKRVLACLNYDTASARPGTIVRDDAAAPGRLIIALDDGEFWLSTECQWRPVADERKPA